MKIRIRGWFVQGHRRHPPGSVIDVGPEDVAALQAAGGEIVVDPPPAPPPAPVAEPAPTAPAPAPTKGTKP